MRALWTMSIIVAGCVTTMESQPFGDLQGSDGAEQGASESGSGAVADDGADGGKPDDPDPSDDAADHADGTELDDGPVDEGGSDDGTVDVDPLPEFVDDCSEGANEVVTMPAGLDVASQSAWMDMQLCAGDLDFYRIDVPAQSWLSLELSIDGSGSGATDLDLHESEHPAIDASEIDVVSETEFDVGGANTIWSSTKTASNEWFAWYNPTDHVMPHWFAVVGYDGAVANYSIETRTDALHDNDVRDCDDMFDDTSTSGPCNTLMAFPQANATEDGYLVTHPPHFSHLRRELIYLVRWAAKQTADAFDDTSPLGLLDMCEDDFEIPGTMDNDPRHPSGTHVNGNDIDIAYYQTGPTNLGVPVCPNNGSFCTGFPDTLDAQRTAYFLAMLAMSPEIRVTGVDTEIFYEVEDAAWELVDQGLLTADDASWMIDNLAFGGGWPYHHHHLHFSWNFEGAHLPGAAQSPSPIFEGPALAQHPEEGCWADHAGNDKLASLRGSPNQ